MSGPAVKFGAFGGNTRGVDPVDGVSGFHTLMDISEPQSIGAPPVAPTLVERCGCAAGERPRVARDRAGYMATHPMGTGNRAGFSVEWGALSRTDRDALWAWIDGELLGTANAFMLDVDGDGETLATVRLTQECREKLMGSAIARIGEVVGVEVEEVLGGE